MRVITALSHSKSCPGYNRLILIYPLLWHRCYYPHQSRGALSPICGIFFLSTTFGYVNSHKNYSESILKSKKSLKKVKFLCSTFLSELTFFFTFLSNVTFLVFFFSYFFCCYKVPIIQFYFIDVFF